MDRYLVVSSDGHAGLRAANYRPYVESKYHDAFDAALPIQIDATRRMGDYFLITEINEEWRAGRDAELAGAWEPAARDKVLDNDGIVGINDFLLLLGSWGPCPAPCPPVCIGDIDGDCEIGISDFLDLLANWTP